MFKKIMERLVGRGDNYKTVEKKVMRYIKSLPDEQIKTIHENLEFTPFTSVLQKEYQKRFSKT